MEEGKIPSLETISTEAEEEEVPIATDIPPSSPRNDRNEKSLEGSATPGGSCEEMVKHSRVSPVEQSPPQSSQEMHDAVLQPNTRGRKSQRYHREQEV